jgi:hypothetical protein
MFRTNMATKDIHKTIFGAKVAIILMCKVYLKHLVAIWKKICIYFFFHFAEIKEDRYNLFSHFNIFR